MGNMVAKRQVVVDSLALDTIRLLTQIAAQEDTISARDEHIKKLIDELNNATSGNLVGEMEAIRVMLSDVSKYSARGVTLQRYVDTKITTLGLPENASQKSQELVTECQIAVGALADQIAELQKEAPAGSGGGSGGAKPDPLPVVDPAKTSGGSGAKAEGDKRVAELKVKAKEGLVTMNLQNSEGVVRSYFRVPTGWSNEKVTKMMDAYRELLKAVEEAPPK